MRYAVLGGSFNPVHNGHIRLAEAALDAGYDRVIFIPVRQSPFKERSQQDNAKERLGMLLASISGRRALTTDACEIRREGISYTIDTMRDVKERYTPEGNPGLIFGDDICRNFSQWECAGELAALADINIARREPDAAVFPYPHRLLHNEVYDVSSHQIRELIARGGCWEHLVPSGAADIIKKKRLYGYNPDTDSTGGEVSPPFQPPAASSASPSPGGGASKPPAGPTLVAIEDTVRGMVNIYRFIHSRNTALHSADLARRFGLPEDAAYIAGITHDMCKEFSPEEMRSLAKKDGLPFSTLEEEKPQLLHGRAAAVLVQSVFRIEDPGIIEAVRYHTLPNEAGMGPLAKILYLTDKIEVGRSTVDNRLRALAFGPDALSDLDRLYTIIRKATLEYLERNGAKSAQTV